MLTEETLNDLRSERDRLRQLLKQTGARIEAIDTILRGGVEAMPELPLGYPARVEESGFDKMRLRDAIRAVLTFYPKGLRPIEVTKELETRGYRHTAQTPLKTVVANDLWRMEKSGLLRKTEKGKYKLPDEQKQTA